MVFHSKYVKSRRYPTKKIYVQEQVTDLELLTNIPVEDEACCIALNNLQKALTAERMQIKQNS